MAKYKVKVGPTIEFLESYGVSGQNIVYTRAAFDIDSIRYVVFETKNGSKWRRKEVKPAGSSISDKDEAVLRRRLPEVFDRARILNGCPQKSYREELWALIQSADSRCSEMTSKVKLKFSNTPPAEKDRKWGIGEFEFGDIEGSFRCQFIPRVREPDPSKRILVTEIFINQHRRKGDINGVEILLLVVGALMRATGTM